MISNRQKSIRVQIRALEKFYAQAMKQLRFPPDAASICLVTNAQMKKWNAAYRGKNKPTDVLSFPTEESINPPKQKKSTGRSAKQTSAKVFSSTSFPSSPSSTSYVVDIAIAPAVAKKNARAFGRSLDDELRILILHGILHLMGYDHETDTGQMERREKRLRRTLGIA
jgi:probable rRNA maturation factor